MFSPKFHFNLPQLQKCINAGLLTEVWKQKILAQLRKQIFLDLIEYRDYTLRIENLSTEICHEIDEGRYRPVPVKTYLVEKSRGLCRQMTLIQPRDLLVMQALSGFLYADLKKHQPTEFAFFEPGDAKFNKGQLLYRGNEYGSIASWKKFQQTIFAFAKDRKWLVVTDIANFYDFINFRHLRNIVPNIAMQVRVYLISLSLY